MDTSAHLPTTEELAAALPADGPRRRGDGWTPPRQRAFLEAIAACCTVREACARVRLSPTLAYALRHSPAGRLFGIGWDAANLRARGAIHDLAIARVIEGYEERISRPNGEVIVRHRHDNRLMLRMLDRLDRELVYNMTGRRAAARAAEQEFDTFLDGMSDELEADLITFDDAADLVPADRAEWTVDQWRSAEAAGLVALVAAEVEQPETAFVHQHVQLRPEPEPGELAARAAARDEVEQPTVRRETAFERQDVQLRVGGAASDEAEPHDHGLRFPALILTAPVVESDDAIAGVQVEDVVARDADPATRRRAEEETWARLRARSRVPLPESLAELRQLAPDRKPLLRDGPATCADPGLHTLYVRRNADGELPAITAASPERDRPARLNE